MTFAVLSVDGKGTSDAQKAAQKDDIMNPTGFILEVPVELRMCRKKRKKMI